VLGEGGGVSIGDSTEDKEGQRVRVMIRTYCDCCGEEGASRVEIDINTEYVSCDLCAACQKELLVVIKETVWKMTALKKA
jgi:hypothetical protein